MTTIEPGKYTITGEVTVLHETEAGYVLVESANGEYLIDPPDFTFSSVEDDKPADPFEPPHNAVVIDEDGDAWQSVYGNWSMIGAQSDSSYFQIRWSQLVENHGPVRVVHTP